MDKDTKANLSDRGTWMRLVYMFLFAVIFNVAEVVVGAVVVLQFLFKLFGGKANQRLRDFGGTAAAYLAEIVAFLTFHTEDMPYPFAPWPAGAPAAKAGGAAGRAPAPAPSQPAPAASQGEGPSTGKPKRRRKS